MFLWRLGLIDLVGLLGRIGLICIAVFIVCPGLTFVVLVVFVRHRELVGLEEQEV